MRRLLAALFLALGLTSCTVVPKHVVTEEPSYDATTPEGLDPRNGGFLDWVVNPDGSTWGAIITADARDRYNLLIDSYAEQYKAEHAIILVRDAGVILTTWTDLKNPHGAPAYKIDSQHYAAFLMMNQWLSDYRDKDSVWMKIKGSP